MICPFCGKDSRSKVALSDDADLLTFKRRGRECKECGQTYETIETATGEPYHKRKRNRYDPDQLELMADGILESRELNHEQQKKVRRIKDELRELHNSTAPRT